MASDDEAPHDWDPEREKKSTDPEALARSFVRAAAEEQKKIEAELASLRKPVARAFVPPPMPVLDLQLSVHRIKNGIVVTYGQGPHGHPLTVDLAVTEYAADGPGAMAIVSRIVQGHLDGSLKAPAGFDSAQGVAEPY